MEWFAPRYRAVSLADIPLRDDTNKYCSLKKMKTSIKVITVVLAVAIVGVTSWTFIKRNLGSDPPIATDSEIVVTATPVEGNPLLVTLADYPALGQISVEEWKDDDFTGKPLKSGTEVQIPNPEVEGAKIRFLVP